MVVMQNLSSLQFQSVRLLHRNIHRHHDNCKSLKGNQIIVLTGKLDGGILQIESKAEVMPELVAYVDGGCLGNPGPSGIGVVIQGMAEGPVRIAKWIGHQDNNVAEYAALMEP